MTLNRDIRRGNAMINASTICCANGQNLARQVDVIARLSSLVGRSSLALSDYTQSETRTLPVAVVFVAAFRAPWSLLTEARLRQVEIKLRLICDNRVEAESRVSE